jgi:hypothetical protein
MLAYKFRSSAQIARALDIIFERRLHCADWSTFNDPREGFFQYSPADQQKLQALRNAKQRYRICCLSKTIESRLLWAHYASGFDGLAIQVELPDHDHDVRIYDVTYEDVLPDVAYHPGIMIDDLALSFLRRKDREWGYEDEVRIIQQDEWYELSGPVKRIIVGHRFNKSLLRALRLVCSQENIVLKCTNIQDQGVVAVDCPNH